MSCISSSGAGAARKELPRVSSQRSLRSVGSGRSAPPRRSGRADFWDEDDEGSSGDDFDFDAFDDDDDHSDFGGGGTGEGGGEEGEVVAVERLALE